MTKLEELKSACVAHDAAHDAAYATWDAARDAAYAAYEAYQAELNKENSND